MWNSGRIAGEGREEGIAIGRGSGDVAVVGFAQMGRKRGFAGDGYYDSIEVSGGCATCCGDGFVGCGRGMRVIRCMLRAACYVLSLRVIESRYGDGKPTAQKS